MTQDSDGICRHEVNREEIIDDGVLDADVIKIGFCPSCGTTVIVLGDRERDIAIVHLPHQTLDGIIADLQSIRQRLRN